MDGKSGFSGLFTAVAETQAPDDALRVADNVVVRSRGAVEPRPGFMPITPDYSMSGITPRDAAVHGAKNTFWDGTVWRSSGGVSRQHKMYVGSGDTNPTKLRQDAFSSALSRGNMYWPHANGVGVTRSSTETRWAFSGSMPSLEIVIGTGSGVGTAFAANSQWAYRAVGKRVDANGLIVRSRPSAAFIYQTAGIAYEGIGLSVSYWPNPGSTVQDYFTEIEIYRTRTFPLTAQPDDEMALVGVITVNFSTIQSYRDTTADAKRGVALYTSPSQGGYEGSNDAAPACAFVETFRGSLFFGNTVGPQRFTISHEWKDRSGSSTGFGFRATTGNYTTGTNTITSVASTVGLEVGMGVTVPGYLVPNLTITNIVGSTVTLSGNMGWPSAVGGQLIFCDSIEVNGTWVPVLTYVALASYEPLFAYPLNQLQATDVYFAYGITPAKGGYQKTWVIEDVRKNTSSFTIRATHGSEVSPAVGSAGGTPGTSSVDIYPNMLMWSNPDEPEHVPPKNFIRVGDKTKAILGLASTRDSMFVFKEDGVWRLSGENGEWVLDPFDMTTFCVLPSSIKKLNNRVFALTNKGVVSVSEAGVEVVSGRISDVVGLLVDNARANFSASGYYSLTGVSGCAAYVDGRNSEYLLLVGDNTLDCGGDAIVFNDQTGAWTTFTFPFFTPVGAGVDALGVPILMHADGVRAQDLSLSTVLGDTRVHAHADSGRSVTISGMGDGPPQVGFSAPHNASVGEVVIHSATSQAWKIVNILSPTYVEVQVLGDDLRPIAAGGGAGAIWGAVTSRVQAHGFAAPGFYGKEWMTANFCFSRFMGPVAVSASFSSAESGTVESSQQTSEVLKFHRTQGRANAHLGNLYTHPIPRRYKRAWLLRLGIEWTVHRGRVVLEAIGTESRAIAPGKPQVNGT